MAMWPAAVLIGVSALLFVAVRDITERAWRPAAWLALAVAAMLLGLGAGVWAAEAVNSSFDELNEVWADYVFERYFAAIVPVMPATAAAAVFAWRALLGWTGEPGRGHGFLASPGCGVLGFVAAVIVALIAAAAAA